MSRASPYPTLCVAVLLASFCTNIRAETAEPATENKTTFRVATFNLAMGLESEGLLTARLQNGEDDDLAAAAEILQRVRPDVVLLNEFDYQPGIAAAELFQSHYLSLSQNGQKPIEYPYSFSAPVNTGVDSGLDLDNDGQLNGPADAWGFGRFPGQYGMLVLSRLPLDTDRARTFRNLRWKSLPNTQQPVNEDGSPYYDAETWAQLRLSSKSHWDIPVQWGNDQVFHLLASHPTPPVFDGPEDRNGLRNQAEIGFWIYYTSDGDTDFIVDDRGRKGGLGTDTAFVIAGDLNADPHDGETAPGVISKLLNSAIINNQCTPSSDGGRIAAETQAGVNVEQSGNPAHDTADFNDQYTGNMRADYVVPSSHLKVIDCGVYWPADGPEANLVDFSDHRLVWIDISLE